MSAYAALKAKDVRPKSPFEPPQSHSSLLENLTSHCNFTPSFENTIYTSTSIFLGLEISSHILSVGTYELVVHRGHVLLNNVHELKEGAAHSIVGCASQSPVLISAMEQVERSENGHREPQKNGVLPKYSTVIELRNLHSGLPAIAQYCPPLKTMHHSSSFSYTFRLLEEPEDNVFGVFFNAAAVKCINALTLLLTTPTSAPDSVMVIGSKNCGKSTFGKTVLNNVSNVTKKPIAYMDLDPSNSEFSIPGTISVTVHSSPTFGLHFCQTDALKVPENKYCYYGFSSAGTLPAHYLKCCKVLAEYYTLHLYPKGIPLVINTPGWVRGLGKDFLIELTGLTNPSQLVYLTHNDAISVGDFEAEEFESQDNPDDDVISGLTYKNLIKLKATRVAPRLNSPLMKLHNCLTYFHHGDTAHTFDFTRQILSSPPCKLFYATGNKSLPESLSGIYALGFDMNIAQSSELIVQFAEVSIMGLCLVPASSIKVSTKNTFAPILLEDFPVEDSIFVCLCMVHSINTKEGYMNIYLPSSSTNLSDSMSPYMENGYRLAMIRGEGEIPLVELIFPEFEDTIIPYLTPEPRTRLGGVWKARKSLGRKNQK